MFSPRAHPPAIPEAALRSLRLALNAPVLIAGELPAGPAQAGIAVHVDESSGGIALTVAVRSLADGSLVCWSFEGDLAGASLDHAIETALSFGESMGFVFDDDLLVQEESDERSRGLEQWSELLGWPAAGPATIDLETEVLAPPPVDEVPQQPAAPHAARPRSSKEGVPLTKFRRRLGGPPPPELAPAPAKTTHASLGRLRLVKRARTGEGGERRPLWLRLLGSF
jgi:hypothetical protein